MFRVSFFRHCEREATEESWHCPETLHWVHEDRLGFDYTLLSAIMRAITDWTEFKLRFDYTLLSAIIKVITYWKQL